MEAKVQPSNGIIGDATGVDLPQMPEDDTAIRELQNKAKYSRSKEYKELKAKADLRVEFYKKFLPNGQLVGTASRKDMDRAWELANLIIAEFDQLFSENEGAEAALNEYVNQQVLSP